MDAGVDTQEKCWNGIEEKMPDISRELQSFRKSMSQCSRVRHLKKNDAKILTEQKKSWRIWKSDQNIVIDEKIGSERREG